METLLAGWVAVDEGDGLSEYSIRLLAQCQELQQAIVRMLRYRVVTAVDAAHKCVCKQVQVPLWFELATDGDEAVKKCDRNRKTHSVNGSKFETDFCVE